MPYYRFDQPDGTSFVAHLKLAKPPQACPFPDFDNPTQVCARMAVALCDYPVGLVLGGGAVDCDLPMCARHRTRVGETLDHCPKHARKELSMNQDREHDETPEPPTEETPAPPPPANSQGDGGTDPDPGDAEETTDAVGGD